MTMTLRRGEVAGDTEHDPVRRRFRRVLDYLVWLDDTLDRGDLPGGARD